MLKNFTPSFWHVRSESWVKLTPHERLAVLQMAEDICAREHGRASRIVRERDLNNRTDGKYESQEPEYINVRKELLTSSSPYSGYDALYAVFHEGRHAFQNDCVDGKVDEVNFPNNAILELWKKNLVVYYDSGDMRLSYSLYRFQPIEIDAFDFSERKIKELEKYFLNDPCYDIFIKGCDADVRYYSALAIDDFGPKYIQKIEEKVNEDYALRQKSAMCARKWFKQEECEDLDELIERIRNASPASNLTNVHELSFEDER